jgi:hypothetical protein
MNFQRKWLKERCDRFRQVTFAPKEGGATAWFSDKTKHADIDLEFFA